MNDLPIALNIVNLLNAATPGIAQLILLIKNNDGTISVPVLLDQADAKFAENIKAATEWMKAHPA